MRSRAPGSRCLPVGAETEGQRDSENTNVFYGLNVALGALTGPERQVNHPMFCPGAMDIENLRSVEGCVGGGGKLNPISEGESFHFLFLSLSFPTSKWKEAGLHAL